jgi:hypothetical protein
MPIARKIVLSCGLIGLACGLALSWAAGSAMVRGRARFVPPAQAPALDLRIRGDDG